MSSPASCSSWRSRLSSSSTETSQLEKSNSGIGGSEYSSSLIHAWSQVPLNSDGFPGCANHSIVVNESLPTLSVYSDPPQVRFYSSSVTLNCQYDKLPQPSCLTRTEIPIVARTFSVLRGRRERTCSTLATVTN